MVNTCSFLGLIDKWANDDELCPVRLVIRWITKKFLIKSFIGLQTQERRTEQYVKCESS